MLGNCADCLGNFKVVHCSYTFCICKCKRHMTLLYSGICTPHLSESTEVQTIFITVIYLYFFKIQCIIISVRFILILKKGTLFVLNFFFGGGGGVQSLIIKIIHRFIKHFGIKYNRIIWNIRGESWGPGSCGGYPDPLLLCIFHRDQNLCCNWRIEVKETVTW